MRKEVQAEPEQKAPNEGSIWCIYRTLRAVWQLYKIVDWRRESGFIVGWAYIVDFEWQPKEYSTLYFLYETLKLMVFDTY